MMLWLLIGWPVSLAAACGFGARLHAAKPPAVQAAEDAEQMASLRAWSDGQRDDAMLLGSVGGDA